MYQQQVARSAIAERSRCVKMWVEVSRVLSQFTCLTNGRTDRQTDRQTFFMANTAPQRGENGYR